MYITLRGAEPPPTQTGKAPRVAGTVLLLGVVSMLTDISSESVSAILPIYLTTVLGASTLAYGFVDGLYQGVSAVTRIAAGYTADRQDRPKWVAVFGYGLSAVARVGLLFFQGIGLITAVITADRIGKGVRTAPRDAMISAASDSRNLGRSFGVHRSLDTLGAVLGPLIAFAILWWIVDGYDVVLAVSLAFALLGVAVLVLVVPDVRPRRSGAPAPAKATAPTAAKPTLRLALTPPLRRLLLVAGLLSLVTIGDGFLYLALMDRSDFATKWFPMFYVATNLAYMLLAIPMGRLADRVGRVAVFLGGHVLLLAAYLCAAVPASAAVLAVATLVLLGAFYASTDGVLAALAGQAAPLEARATGIAAAQTVVALARFVSSVVFGALWYFVSVEAAIACVAAALVVLLAVSWWVLRPEVVPSA